MHALRNLSPTLMGGRTLFFMVGGIVFNDSVPGFYFSFYDEVLLEPREEGWVENTSFWRLISVFIS